MINNKGSLETKKEIANVEKTMIYVANSEIGTYSHHASLTYFGGKFYVMWSCGKVNEDDNGQRVLMSDSTDGVHFSEPKPLFDSMEGNAVLTAAGFFVRNDGILNAYAGLYYYPDSERPKGDMSHIGTTLLVKSSADGKIWSDAIDIHIPIIPNQGPHYICGGRLMIAGNITFPWTDSPDGIKGWTVAGVPPCPVDGLQDDSEGFHIHTEKREDNLHLCEGSFFEKNGEILMLLRDAGKKEYPAKRCLALSRSLDGGKTYLLPEETEFTDNNSKFYCMRLSDGRYSIISNPDPIGPRCPLSITTSIDGENFTHRYDIATEKLPRRFEGMYKGGVYGYPHAIEVNGKIYVVCSINKEDVVLFSFKLTELY